jgi:undecaprenyl-diphosphatase
VTLMIGTIISGIIGYISIWFLLRYLRTHTTGLFVAYRLIVGIAILVALMSGRLGPL